MTSTGRQHRAAAGTEVWNPTRNPPVMSRTPLTRPAPLITPITIPVYADDDDDEPRPARRRRRILIALTYLLLAAAVLFLGRYVRADDDTDRIVVPAAAPRPSIASHKATPVKLVPLAGTSGSFTYAAGRGPVLGAAGPIHRFRVAVEKPTGPVVPAGFAAAIDRTLGDPRSWIKARRFRFQRVPGNASAEFTIFLASARTSERMCRTGGLETGAYTSCRVSGHVIINVDRWQGAVRDYGAPVATYREYVINHEVGHELGHGHEKCPGKGRRAPVMMQQTFGLKGCVANAWPYP